MATTIQLTESTKQRLEIVKEQEKYASYDAVVNHLLEKHTKIPDSMFGKLPRKIQWTKKDKKEFFHER